MAKRISILGSTGSIGRNVLDVIRRSKGAFEVVCLAAGQNISLLLHQITEFRPRVAVVMTQQLADELKGGLSKDLGVEILYGKEGYKEAASLDDVDMVVSAMVGAAGLIPTLCAIEAGKDVALANKETLVTAGPLVQRLARENEVAILPVDSEHSAIFQCLEGQKKDNISRLVLTASGGPFRDKSQEDMEHVTVEEAVNHPNWDMGAKISVDSATLMNKGLEVIEARYLFDITYDDIEVIIHPQSIVHSMVEFKDGSLLAQMGIPDMRGPIAYALSWPDRIDLEIPRLDLSACPPLTFESPDYERFPCLSLAYEAGRRGGTATTALNAANEVAVDAFLKNKIGFLDISRTVKSVLETFPVQEINSLDDVLRADALARLMADNFIYANCNLNPGG